VTLGCCRHLQGDDECSRQDKYENRAVRYIESTISYKEFISVETITPDGQFDAHRPILIRWMRGDTSTLARLYTSPLTVILDTCSLYSIVIPRGASLLIASSLRNTEAEIRDFHVLPSRPPIRCSALSLDPAQCSGIRY
jgi:hypothetical protein